MGDSRYQYDVPAALIATTPAVPRDAARLLVYDTARDELSDHVFRDLPDLIPSSSLLVLNDTKVVPARVRFHRVPSGGIVPVLFLVNEGPVAPRQWRALAPKRLAAGDRLAVDGWVCTVMSTTAGEYTLDVGMDEEEFFTALERWGEMPLPPYLRQTSLGPTELATEYQTVFAQTPASVAAPTAALHFTPELFTALTRRGVAHTAVTLAVGRGTFSPLTPGHWQSGRLHLESYEISAAAAATITATREAGRPIIAVGTTTVRVLEAAAAHGPVQPGPGTTDIFLHPPHSFQVPTGLITNFHLPGTSLLALVDAFLQHKQAARSWRDLYAHAIAARYRFYSFGDAMLIR